MWIDPTELAAIFERAKESADGRADLERFTCNRLIAEGKIDGTREFTITQSGEGTPGFGFVVTQR